MNKTKVGPGLYSVSISLAFAPKNRYVRTGKIIYSHTVYKLQPYDYMKRYRALELKRRIQEVATLVQQGSNHSNSVGQGWSGTDLRSECSLHHDRKEAQPVSLR